MWTCPICNQEFVNTKQAHACRDKNELGDFLSGKSAHTIELFNHFLNEYQQIGEVKVHPGKDIISISARTRLAYVSRLGTNFIDVVFPFKEPYENNLCFSKINQIAGSGVFYHHLRIYFKDDINDEVRMYMKKAYENAC